MSGYTYGEKEPIRRCPYCEGITHADFVDVGVGFMQCGPYHCLSSDILPRINSGGSS